MSHEYTHHYTVEAWTLIAGLVDRAGMHGVSGSILTAIDGKQGHVVVRLRFSGGAANAAVVVAATSFDLDTVLTPLFDPAKDYAEWADKWLRERMDPNGFCPAG